ncbi:MAG TPA: potassium channel family protein [Arenibaculum sp.]|nr:potassium channel family protein [Arenibaculum sp.]
MSLFSRLYRKRRTSVGALIPSARPLRSLRRLVVLLLVLASLHVAAMVAFEGLNPFEALWLTMTTMTTVGYGDYSAETYPGRLSTMLLVFLGGIWVAFQSAATYFEYRSDRRDLMRCGRWRWNMHDHILILNTPAKNATAYLIRLACEFRASRRFRDRVLQIVTTCFETGLPESLHKLGVVHFSGEPWDPQALEAANGESADVIVILAESDSDPGSDSRTLDIVDRLRGMGARGRIIAECVDDTNRPRMRRFGADIVVRPLRGYPEMIVRALAAPGAEAILEDLFTSKGDECWRYDVDVTAWQWAELASMLIKHDIGVPVAFRSAKDKKIRINPSPDTFVEADKLYVLVRAGNARPDEEICALVSGGRGRRGMALSG